MKKIVLILSLMLAPQFVLAASDELTGPQALALFHQMVWELRIDTQKWVAHGRDDIKKIHSTPAAKACTSKKTESLCATAIKEAMPYSVLPIRDRRIFQLDKDLKTRYKFDVETGMRVFQLSTALRWLAREDIYNGVPAPKKATATSYSQFVKQIDGYIQNKAVELKKAAPMIPPPSRR